MTKLASFAGHMAEFLARLWAGSEEERAALRMLGKVRPSKHRVIGSDRSRRRQAARAAHVARVGEQTKRSRKFFAEHGRKPPRKLRVKWAKEIARDVAA